MNFFLLKMFDFSWIKGVIVLLVFPRPALINCLSDKHFRHQMSSSYHVRSGAPPKMKSSNSCRLELEPRHFIVRPIASSWSLGERESSTSSGGQLTECCWYVDEPKCRSVSNPIRRTSLPRDCRCCASCQGACLHLTTVLGPDVLKDLLESEGGFGEYAWRMRNQCCPRLEQEENQFWFGNIVNTVLKRLDSF